LNIIDPSYDPVIAAENNWWGNASGPTHGENPPGTGAAVSDKVDYSPWLCEGADTSPDVGFQPVLSSCVLDEQGPVTSAVALTPNTVVINGLVEVTANVDDNATGGSKIASAEYSLNGGAWVPMSSQDGGFDEVAEQVTASFMVTQLGQHSVCVRGTDVPGYTGEAACASFYAGYHFAGFFAPIDMGVTNSAKAGQAIPVKWRLTDGNGVPVDDVNSFVMLRSYRVNCDTLADEGEDAIEDYAGSSGLQYLGDGYWQFNWKTIKTYAGQCREMYVEFQGGVTSPFVSFRFKK
jgi:hypothetical protein